MDAETHPFGDGDEVMVATEDKPVRFLLVSGQPIGEPVAWYGPIVVNTQEELCTALRSSRHDLPARAGDKHPQHWESGRVVDIEAGISYGWSQRKGRAQLPKHGTAQEEGGRHEREKDHDACR